MTVRKKFDKNLRHESMSLDTIISRGANVKEDSIMSKEWSFLNLRIPTSLLNELNEHLESKIGISRTGWILQAIQDKLKHGEQ